MQQPSTIAYKKLASRHSTSGKQALYLAEDHLLIVDGTYTQKYRRLYLNDIQALLWCKTHSHIVLALLLSIIVGLLLIGSIATQELPTAPWIFASINFPFVLMLIHLIFQKGSVYFGLVTPVQNVRLECISSLRKAQNVERKVAAAIEAVQGPINEERLRSNIER